MDWGWAKARETKSTEATVQQNTTLTEPCLARTQLDTLPTHFPKTMPHLQPEPERRAEKLSQALRHMPVTTHCPEYGKDGSHPSHPTGVLLSCHTNMRMSSCPEYEAWARKPGGDWRVEPI